MNRTHRIEIAAYKYVFKKFGFQYLLINEGEEFAHGVGEGDDTAARL
jgi:hypothetical protein